MRAKTVLALAIGLVIGCGSGGGGSVVVQAASDFYGRLVEIHFDTDQQDLSGRVVFIGDSIIQRWDVNAVTPGSVNFGIGGEITGGVSTRIGQFNFAHTARAVVVAVGTNDLAYSGHTLSASSARLREILVAISVPIILTGIHPVNEDRRGKGLNDEIAAYNAAWELACSEFPNCTFVPSPFDAPLAPEYDKGDGIHLTPRAYSVWANSVREVLIAAGVL